MPIDERIAALYRAFNGRRIDDLLDRMAPDVDWPNGWEGGRVLGREAVRAYWTRQFEAIDPSVEPTSITERDDGSVAVGVHQRIRDHDGKVLDEGDVTHVYAFDADGQ